MTTPVSSVNSASTLTTNYLSLLITQLKNQNPLDPMDNNAMTSQMAQLSQLQQMENISTQLGDLKQLATLNTSFGKVLANTQLQYATSLIGKAVAYPLTTDGVTKTATGVVQGVQMINGSPKIIVNDTVVEPATVTAIAGAPASSQAASSTDSDASSNQ